MRKGKSLTREKICLLCWLNNAVPPVRPEPTAPGSRVKHSTEHTAPQILHCLTMVNVLGILATANNKGPDQTSSSKSHLIRVSIVEK